MNTETQKITDKVKTIEDVIAIANPSDEVKALIAYDGTDSTMIGLKKAALLFLIVDVLNEGWKPNWNDTNEYKWWPWFNMNTISGVGFSRSACDSWSANSGVGSRLCYKSEELSDYAATTFINVYKEFLTK